MKILIVAHVFHCWSIVSFFTALTLLEFPFRPFFWSGLVQVARRNPVILRTKVFPTSSNFRRSRRSSFARPLGMLAVWKSTLGGCRPSDKGGWGSLRASVWSKNKWEVGSPGFATGVSYYFWRSLVVLAQCWDLWSLLFTIQLYIVALSPFRGIECFPILFAEYWNGNQRQHPGKTR